MQTFNRIRLFSKCCCIFSSTRTKWYYSWNELGSWWTPYARCKSQFLRKNYKSVQYGLHPTTNEVDYDQVRTLAIEHKPKLIIAGFSAYSGIIDWKKFRDIADEIGAYFLVDMAHISGLVASGHYPSPVPYADVVTSTTHKTLRGPRSGIILAKSNELLEKNLTLLYFLDHKVVH